MFNLDAVKVAVGNTPDRARAESRRNEALEHEFSRLQRKLERAEQIIKAQKKCANC